MRVVVTGGAGYIGGQTVLQLLDHGHSVLAIDQDLHHSALQDMGDKWLTADFASEVALGAIKTFQPDAIIHCAGTSLVGPSIMNPAEYYDNNFVKTKRLCDFLVTEKIKARLIFSSSAATYGNPIMTPCQEVDPTEPISPYGESKLMVEWMLESYHRAYELDYVSFRYFNACGADSQARHGQKSGATHIIARLLETIKNDQQFTCYGNDYQTNDGTCIRDYVHVEDLARAHIMALDPIVDVGVYNLGSENGSSNREVIAMVKQVIGKDVRVVDGPRRTGDPAVLTANPNKFQKISGWTAKYKLDDIIRHAWAWYNK